VAIGATHSASPGPRADSGRSALDIDAFIGAIEQAYGGWDAPVITLMAHRGARPFEVLLSTVLSLRTKDAVTHEASKRLLAVARTPRQVLELTEERLAELIYPVGFYLTKARRLRQISRLLLDRHDGRVPQEIGALLELPGVGRKTANLVLAEGFKIPAICVDTHVHRISNRIGLVSTKTPEKTEFALRRVLPEKYWIRYNKLLVAFGQTICRPVSPLCSVCPAAGMCPRSGVERSR
jgi:endonuclease-3